MSIVGEVDPNLTPPPRPQPQVAQVPFNPAMPCRTYTPAQWVMKEDWYANQCNNIRISDAPTTAEVQNAAVQIDALLSVARIDYAYVSQMYYKYSMQLKIEEKRLFVDLKLKPPTQYSSMKLTVDEMKGVVASVINTQPWNGSTHNLYDLVMMSSARHIFMEGIIKVLQDKKDLLITHSGILKIENSLSGMQSNAPGYDRGYRHSQEDN